MALKSSREGLRKELVDYLGNIIIDDNLKQNIIDSVDDVFINNEELTTSVNELDEKIRNEALARESADSNLESNKANKSDVLTLEEIQASTDLSGKIASASAVKELKNETITIGSMQSDNGRCEGGWLKIGKLAVITGVFTPSSDIPIETSFIYGIPAVASSNNVPFVVRDNTELNFSYFKLQNIGDIASDFVLKNGHSYRFTVCYICQP